MAARGRREFLPPGSEAEAKQRTLEIFKLHGGGHVGKLVRELKPDASSREMYEAIRNQALVTCALALGLREGWALGEKDARIRFHPSGGTPLDTPEARLSFMEDEISGRLGRGNRSSLELLRRLAAPNGDLEGLDDREVLDMGLGAMERMKKIRREDEDDRARRELARERDFPPTEKKSGEGGKPAQQARQKPAAEAVTPCPQCGDEIGGAPFCLTCGHKTPPKAQTGRTGPTPT